MSVVIWNLHSQKRERIAEAKANGTYVEPNDPWKISSETAMGRFMQRAGNVGAAIGIAAVGSMAAVSIVAAGAAVAIPGAYYVAGAVRPAEYHRNAYSQMGARHVREVGGFVNGLKVAVESNLDTMTAKVFVNDIAAKVPRQEQAATMKTQVEAELQQLHQRAAEMKKAQEPTLELVSSHESYR